ncbi:hypothetical protein SAMN04244553_3565 [Nocardia amikacinitolerans]|uniref:Uncharacterized protein n=1 Tax=Nocardia amikacinitolerans TaxID=756689 RepID=A0A285LG14_9NOCA|nr:hypothetical protein [Nocardia amikacinitolerans]SNY83792.1 hypothetical protein SAMN04244553_3565 [Nocardia amikacinitolerans]
MTSRSRQAGQLAYRLCQRTGCHVECNYLGPRRDSYGGWRIEWCDGPTEVEMRQHVADLAAPLPAIATADLRYGRGDTDQARAVALLLWLDEHRADARHLGWNLAYEVYRETSYPNRADDIWQARAKTLLRATRHGVMSDEALALLREHATVGWDSTLAWLDSPTDGARHLRVVQ